MKGHIQARHRHGGRDATYLDRVSRVLQILSLYP
jgi:hypothetical protein